MAPRQQLSEILNGIAPHVYFQPKSNQKLEYPCLVYARDGDKSKFADNVRYAHTFRYRVTVMDSDPDSPLIDSILALPHSSYENEFATAGLHHITFTLYF